MDTMKIPRIVTMDPGKWACGIAEFRYGKLHRAWCARTKKDPELTEAENYLRTADTVINSLADGTIDLFVYEQMVARRGKMSFVKDLIALSTVSGSIIAQLDVDRVAFVSPKWTGNRAKKINHLLIRKRIDDRETAILDRAIEAETNTAHHKEILDAVGIGLYMTKRL